MFEKYMLIASPIAALMPFFQMIEIYLKQTSSGVSLSAYLLAGFSGINWLIYGCKKNDRVLILTNCVALTGVILVLIAIMYYK